MPQIEPGISATIALGENLEIIVVGPPLKTKVSNNLVELPINLIELLEGLHEDTTLGRPWRDYPPTSFHNLTILLTNIN
jgi:hypothetical protein|uniref:Uncharacterized protein n=1 Tax=Picea glauca TaxID=3330 RepID=A0A101LVR6_PICGL|nr:hypothetical protein ABT39_MTgene1747 [Picea glauca]QHR88420.1 hypothetical protein Q903MT_gene2433 [Picea sitchensis]